MRSSLCLAALFLVALAFPAAAQVLPPSPTVAPDGSAVASMAQGGRSYSAGMPWLRASAGVSKVRSLESFAVQLGVSLGTSDDGAVFSAANNAIIAAAHSGGLVVALPANGVELTSVGLILDNNGGWVCAAPRACVVRMVRTSSSSATTYAAQVNPSDAAATGMVLQGVTFDGQWVWCRSPYSSSCGSDPWVDHQNGVNLSVQFNGVNDAAYQANNSIGAQEPHILVRDVRIGEFGGTCFAIQGAGANEVSGVTIENCGGEGFDVDTYDSHFSDLDVGATGRQPFLCHDNCASDVFTNLKGWYGGYRQIAGAEAGWDEEGGSSNIVMGLYIQDEAGDCIKRDNADLGVIHGHCQWQGYINTLPGQVCVLRSLAGIDSQIELDVSLINHSGQIYQNVSKLICDGRSLRNTGYTGYSYHNQISMVTEGFPQDFNAWSDTWRLGPLDTSNSVMVNGVPRQPAQYAPDPATGQLNYGASMCGTLAGLVAFGPQSPYPGAVSVIAPCGGAFAIQNETTTGAYATGTLTSTQNYANGETVTVGTNVYTFRSSLTGAPYEVHIGGSEAASLANLTYAINAATPASVTAAAVSGDTLTVNTVTGPLHVGDTVSCADPINCTSWSTTTIAAFGTGAGGIGTYTLANSEPTIAFSNAISAASGVIGTDYGWGTSPSFQVGATNNGAHVLTVKALSMGVAGNSIPIATTAAHAAWGGGDLTGGAADAQSYVNAVQAASGLIKLPGTIALPTYANDGAACAAVGNGGIYRDNSGGGGALHIASC